MTNTFFVYLFLKKHQLLHFVTHILERYMKCNMEQYFNNSGKLKVLNILSTSINQHTP